MRLIAINAADDATVTEYQTANLLINPGAFDVTANWVRTRTSVTANPTPPVGTPAFITGADLLVEDTSNNTHILHQVVASRPAGRYTYAVSIAPGGRSRVRLSVHDDAATSNNVQADFDLTAGTVVFSNNGSGITSVRGSAGYNAGGGWRRCIVTFDTTSTLNLRCRITPQDASGAASYAGDGVSGVYLCRAVLELSPVASVSYLDGINGRFLASLPAANVQREGRGLVARTKSDGRGSPGWQGTWPADRTVRAAVLYRHNLSAGASVRLVLFDAANTGGNIVYDSGNEEAQASNLWGAFSWVDDVLAPRFSAIWLPAAVTARSFLLLVNDGENPAGYVQAKRLVIGDYIEPAANLQLGLNAHWIDDSQQTRTQAGSLRTDPQARYRTVKGKLRLTDAERTTWMQATGYAGTQREVFVSVYPGVGGSKERDHALLGKFKAASQLETDQPLDHTGQVEILEV